MKPSRIDTAAPGSPRPLLLSAEMGFVLAVGLTLAAFGQWVVTTRSDPAEWALLDLREWRVRVVAPDGSAADYDPQALAALQVPQPSRRPFRLEVELPTLPRAGAAVVAQRTFAVDPDETYCFQVYVTSSYYNPDSPLALSSFTARASANERRTPPLPIAAHREPHLWVLRDIVPRDGQVTVRLAVESHVTHHRESWRRASRVAFEYADLWPCS